MRRKVCFFGHFGSANLGNEVTLQTMLYHLRIRLPEAKLACICTGPDALRAIEKIETIPISERMVKPRRLRTRFARWFRKIFIGVPSELWRWLGAFNTLDGTDMLIIPGTGLLTDAYGLYGWGPYNLFKWSVIAKLRGSKVFFLSVGAGPLYSAAGRYFVKSALSMADFRSYRDEASLAYLRGIGFPTNSDRVYPDLAFGLPEIRVPHGRERGPGGPVIGLGVMASVGMYGVGKPSNGKYREYLDNLVAFAEWLVAHGYVIRLLVGDASDDSASKEFKSQLKASFKGYDEKRIIDEPAISVEQLLLQIAATDIVVATRFHNVLLALVLNKPVIAISFHHKSDSLMSAMGLTEYCDDINCLNADRLIAQFQAVESNAEQLKIAIRQRVEQLRNALDEQYKLVFESR